MMRDPSRFTVLNGFIPNAQRAELFARAAVVVLPYVEASQSGVVPVAYAAGKPVVATSVGGLPEVVEDGRTGLLVPPGDHRALADAIACLLEDPAARDDMGSAGRRKLEREWSPQVVAEQTLHVYEKALSEQAPSATGERDCQSAALRLHRQLLGASWRGDGLVGPDSGIRFNYRVGRFVKSYVPALSWSDDLYYMQTQGYWILGTGQVRDITGDERLDAVVAATARGVVARQRPEGAWGYPNPEWRGRVATAEGSWAAIGLLDAYRRTGDPEFLEAAIRWHRFLEKEIGYQAVRGGLAVNYFAGGAQNLAVPNNSALVLRVLAELTDASGDPRFLRRAPDLVRFLAEAQLPTGEMPYALGVDGIAGRRHFQCAQYNAFQCLDVIRYVELTGDQQAAGLARTMAGFLRTRVRPDGSVAYACDKGVPLVAYHGAAVAAALHQGARLGEAYCAEPRDRACARLLALQRDDGAFPHSRRDYGVLRDDRAYPRNLAMILHHLLVLDDVPLGQGHRRESEALA
jgi:hypothetical protein